MGGIIITENGEIFQFGDIVRADLILSALANVQKQLAEQELKRLTKVMEGLNADRLKAGTEDNS